MGASRINSSSRQEGQATDPFVKTLCGENRMLLGPHHQLPAGWFHDVELTEALWHQNPVAVKDNVQEDQMRHRLPGN